MLDAEIGWSVELGANSQLPRLCHDSVSAHRAIVPNTAHLEDTGSVRAPGRGPDGRATGRVTPYM